MNNVWLAAGQHVDGTDCYFGDHRCIAGSQHMSAASLRFILWPCIDTELAPWT